MGKNFDGPDFAFIVNTMPMQQLELILKDVAKNNQLDKMAADEQIDQTKDENIQQNTTKDLDEYDLGRFGNWEYNYWKMSVLSPKYFCIEENEWSYDCQNNTDPKSIMVSGWMTNAFTHSYVMDTISAEFYAERSVNWVNPTPEKTPIDMQLSYSVSIGVEPISIGFGVSITLYTHYTHTETSYPECCKYRFFFDWVSVTPQYLEYRDSETYPEATLVSIQHDPHSTYAGSTVQCTVTSYNYPLYNSGGDIGWIPTTFGPATGSFNITVH